MGITFKVIVIFLFGYFFFPGVVEAVGPIKATFVNLYGLPSTKVVEYINEVQSLGINTIVIHSTRERVGACTNLTFRDVPNLNTSLPILMSETRAKGINVYLGLNLHPENGCNIYGLFDNPSVIPQVINDTSYMVNRLENSYGSYSNLKGWYIPDEPNIIGVYDDAYRMEAAYQLFTSLNTVIKQRSPSKKTLISPNFTGAHIEIGSPGYLPAVAADVATNLKNRAGIDYQAWQDTVGQFPADGYPRPISEYISAVSQAIGRDNFWINNELFSYLTVRATMVKRLARQIQDSPDWLISNRIVWTQDYYMSTVWGYRHLEAERMKETYKAYYGLGGQYINPVRYSWITTPDSRYPDEGNDDLIDGVLASQRFGDSDPIDAKWIGFINNAKVSLDLGSEKRVDWVSVHVMRKDLWAVRYPNSMKITCVRASGVSESPITILLSSLNTPTQLSTTDGEYVMGNTSKLLKTCIKIDIELIGNGWIFVSEVELAASAVVVTPSPSPTATSTIRPTTTATAIATATASPTATATPPHKPGDANGDSRVDGIDYVIFLNNYGASSPRGISIGDFNFSGNVDGVDYVIWLNNYLR